MPCYAIALHSTTGRLSGFACFAAAHPSLQIAMPCCGHAFQAVLTYNNTPSCNMLSRIRFRAVMSHLLHFAEARTGHQQSACFATQDKHILGHPETAHKQCVILHLLIIFFISKLAKDISVEGFPIFIDRRLAPTPRLVPKAGARRDGSIQSRHLRSTTLFQ